MSTCENFHGTLTAEWDDYAHCTRFEGTLITPEAQHQQSRAAVFFRAGYGIHNFGGPPMDDFRDGLCRFWARG